MPACLHAASDWPYTFLHQGVFYFSIIIYTSINKITDRLLQCSLLAPACFRLPMP